MNACYKLESDEIEYFLTTLQMKPPKLSRSLRDAYYWLQRSDGWTHASNYYSYFASKRVLDELVLMGFAEKKQGDKTELYRAKTQKEIIEQLQK